MHAHDVVTWSAPSMGGRLNVAITTDSDRRAAAEAAARRTGQRISTWASRLTRFDERSDLCQLNRSRAATVRIRPTLAAALGWAATAHERSDGVVDATLLDARLAAETGDAPGTTLAAQGDTPEWSITSAGRSAVVDRKPSTRFDLDGLAKGWIADRAADLLSGWPGVAVDADGDVALHADPGVEWLVAVSDPAVTTADTRDPAPLVTLRLTGGRSWTRRYGIATSGTSVHRWRLTDGTETHHLIDRRTGRPAETDVVQATVLAVSAREAEMIAKTAVILGSREALGYLRRSAALTAVLLLESGEVVGLKGIHGWLA